MVDQITEVEPSGTSSAETSFVRDTLTVEEDEPFVMKKPEKKRAKFVAQSKDIPIASSSRKGTESWKEKYFESIMESEKLICNKSSVTSNLKSYNLLLQNIKLERELKLSYEEIRYFRSSIDDQLNIYPNCHTEVVIEDPIVIEINEAKTKSDSE